ncbi:glycosyltransferase 87 family protein [Streptacidiphilus sp. PB12-B1b]|uniref:glycosyltransferase 87 family protein n=1 Tax=Streptacidiphilus sp. PB12-B1b TaxID=2705012 RepID=UPI001CDC0F09|nr:glycosyltransferase 87 family protein [Streptacidiphilus sp. PB12-B1b]
MTTTHVPEAARKLTAVSPVHAGPRRLPWVLGALVCAGWAGFFPLFSDLGPQRSWGLIAAGGYLLAAGAAGFAPRHHAPRIAVAVALLGAVAVPLAVMLATGAAQSEVHVVQNSAAQLLRTGSPYLPNPRHVIGYDPYLPAMALFGLPRAWLGSAGAAQFLGDARPWFLAVFVGCLATSWRLLRPARNGTARGGAARGGAAAPPVRCWFALAAVAATPLIALTVAVSGVDLPLIGCCLLGLACAERGYAVRAGLVIALACALKWTAWPALPVALLLLQQRHGLRTAARCALVALAAGALLIVPSVLVSPGAVVEQVVRFPLGLSRMHTPANSPLPGHLLAELGPAGRTASLVLLGLGGAAVALWLFLRPPRTAVQAADRLAAGVAVAFLLAPAGRFGYLELPVLLFLWPRLALGSLRPPSFAVLRRRRPAVRSLRRSSGSPRSARSTPGIVSQEDVVLPLSS